MTNLIKKSNHISRKRGKVKKPSFFEKIGLLLIFLGFLFLLYYFNPTMQHWIAPTIELTLYLITGVICEFLGIFSIFHRVKKGTKNKIA